MIAGFGWLSDKGQRNFVTFRINSFVYTSVLILCFSLTENLHQLCIVLHTSTLKTSAKVLRKYSFHGASQNANMSYAEISTIPEITTLFEGRLRHTEGF